MSIRRVQKLREQGPRGSTAYQEATAKARAYGQHCFAHRIMLGTFSKSVSSWVNPPLGPPLDPLKYGTPRRVITGVIGANGKG